MSANYKGKHYRLLFLSLPPSVVDSARTCQPLRFSGQTTYSIKMFSKLVFVLSTLALAIQGSYARPTSPAPTPAPPGLNFLYSLNCTLGTAIPVGTGPRGSRIVIPITGGTFQGPKLKGGPRPIPSLFNPPAYLPLAPPLLSSPFLSSAIGPKLT